MLLNNLLLIASCVCFAGIQPALARPQYAEKIPNGYTVPNPGPQGGIWAGVGHENAAGGGELNPFGEDFATNGYLWTPELCQLDSDGDGRSNGEELGDPDCVWMEGDDPDGPAMSHPGIVDDVQGASTVNSCAKYVAPDDEITFDIAFSAPTEIDGTQTHYICEQRVLDVPAQTTLHLIKKSILLDNVDTLHHMFVFICPVNATSTDGERVGEGAYQCSGNESGCRRVAGWAVGPHESCEPDNVGVEIDFSSNTKVVVKIEAHYDNTSGEPQQDQSGIRLYMTSTLRPLTSSQMITGMATANVDFSIPAQQSLYPLTNTCPTAVTEHLDHAVYAYAFTPHMHLYGKQLVTEQYRCGQKIGDLGRIDDYEFDNQQTYNLDPPIKILPGDALVTTCGFDTTTIDFSVAGGEETTDEMCLNFLSIYPHPGTEEVPSLLGSCFSFEHGLARDGRIVPFPFAIGDMEGSVVTPDFESDPRLSYGSCCAANNCDELYLSDVGGACGVDADCVVNLECEGGLCISPVDAATPATNNDEATEDALNESDISTSAGNTLASLNLLVLAILLAGLGGMML